MKIKDMITLYAIVVLLATSASAAYYNCTIGPDYLGNYVNEVVDSRTVLNCGDFCSCVGFMNNTCHFGPDAMGHFTTKEVSSEVVDSCDRKFCTCDSHNIERTNKTFESLLQEKYEMAVNLTSRDASNLTGNETDPVYLEGEPFERFVDQTINFDEEIGIKPA